MWNFFHIVILQVHSQNNNNRIKKNFRCTEQRGRSQADHSPHPPLFGNSHYSTRLYCMMPSHIYMHLPFFFFYFVTHQTPPSHPRLVQGPPLCCFSLCLSSFHFSLCQESVFLSSSGGQFSPAPHKFYVIYQLLNWSIFGPGFSCHFCRVLFTHLTIFCPWSRTVRQSARLIVGLPVCLPVCLWLLLFGHSFHSKYLFTQTTKKQPVLSACALRIPLLKLSFWYKKLGLVF